MKLLKILKEQELEDTLHLHVYGYIQEVKQQMRRVGDDLSLLCDEEKYIVM